MLSAFRGLRSHSTLGRLYHATPKPQFCTSRLEKKIEAIAAPGLHRKPKYKNTVDDNAKDYWGQFFLAEPLKKAIDELEWKKLTPIQARIFKEFNSKKSIVASAETGTGKTGAYLLPLLEFLQHYRKNPKVILREQEPKDGRQPRGPYSPLGLILCPTKELSFQVKEHLDQLAKHIDPPIRATVLAVPGTPRILRGLPEDESRLDVVIGTPGRILSMAKQRGKFLLEHGHYYHEPSIFDEQGLDLSWVKMFITDECDRLLSLGFFPDIKEIMEFLPRPRKKLPARFPGASMTKVEKEGKRAIVSTEDRMQVFLFSATLVPEIQNLITRIAPSHSLINLNADMKPATTVDEITHLVSNRRKYPLLKYYLKRKGSMRGSQVLVFCRTSQRVDRLMEALEKDKFLVGGIHSGMPPSQRVDVMKRFRSGEISILVATDVVGRGIDVVGLPFVVNYDVPINPHDYVHRIGRTGRAGLKGKAITFTAAFPQMLNFGGRYVEHNEIHLLNKVRAFIKKPLHFRKVPGPWKDNPNDPIVKQEEMISQDLYAKREAEFQRLAQSKPKKGEEGTLAILKQRADFRAKLPTRDRFLRVHKAASKFSLRHFREGRAEDVLMDWDIKRANKRGVIVDHTHVNPLALKVTRKPGKKRFRKRQPRLTKKKYPVYSLKSTH